MKISYTYRDETGDEIRLIGRDRAVTLNVTGPDIELNRRAVAALQVFLTEWQERTTPAPPTPEPLLRSMTRQVIEQLTEPLCGRSAPADVHHASRCTFCGHLWVTHRIADPEPKDVGHPEEPVTAPKQLVGCECGHRKNTHSRSLGCLHEYEAGEYCTCELNWDQVRP